MKLVPVSMIALRGLPGREIADPATLAPEIPSSQNPTALEIHGVYVRSPVNREVLMPPRVNSPSFLPSVERERWIA